MTDTSAQTLLHSSRKLRPMNVCTRKSFYPLDITTCMTEVASHRLTYSRRYGFPLYRALRTGDGQLVPAGLLTCGSGVFSGLPEDLYGEIFSGFSRSRLAAYSCEGSLGIGARSAAPCSLFMTTQLSPRANRHTNIKEINWPNCQSDLARFELVGRNRRLPNYHSGPTRYRSDI